jgi:hypothetical protein
VNSTIVGRVAAERVIPAPAVGVVVARTARQRVVAITAIQGITASKAALLLLVNNLSATAGS